MTCGRERAGRTAIATRGTEVSNRLLPSPLSPRGRGVGGEEGGFPRRRIATEVPADVTSSVTGYLRGTRLRNE